MDDMTVDSTSPQEDEFALCGLGAPTPYLRIAFPNHPPAEIDMLDFRQTAPEKIERFRAALDFFFKSLTYHYGGRRLVLKSPPHTGRIRWLSSWYPGAKFIHLSRHPAVLVESTMRLWRSLDQTQGFQLPRYSLQELEDFVFQAHRRMYAAYFAQRTQIPRCDLIELKYEELTSNPEQALERIYDQLALGPLPTGARANLAEYLNRRQNVKPKSKRPDSATEERVRREWPEYFEAFGYETAAPQRAAI
jgi:hypothetical protein